MTCRVEGCKRAPLFEDQPYCADHRLRWVTREPRLSEPEWMRRRRLIGLPAKILSDYRPAS